MNVNFEFALKYIDIEEYDKAIEYINKAIDDEEAAENRSTATEYRCVLGELYANLDRQEESKEQFEAVLAYCDETLKLPKQRHIAQTYLNAFNGILPANRPEDNRIERPGDIPLVPKPIQNKAFITRQMKKKHR